MSSPVAQTIGLYGYILTFPLAFIGYICRFVQNKWFIYQLLLFVYFQLHLLVMFFNQNLVIHFPHVKFVVHYVLLKHFFQYWPFLQLLITYYNFYIHYLASKFFREKFIEQFKKMISFLTKQRQARNIILPMSAISETRN